MIAAPMFVCKTRRSMAKVNGGETDARSLCASIRDPIAHAAYEILPIGLKRNRSTDSDSGFLQLAHQATERPQRSTLLLRSELKLLENKGWATEKPDLRHLLG
jgi:hypothetical protein